MWGKGRKVVLGVCKRYVKGWGWGGGGGGVSALRGWFVVNGGGVVVFRGALAPRVPAEAGVPGLGRCEGLWGSCVPRRSRAAGAG